MKPTGHPETQKGKNPNSAPLPLNSAVTAYFATPHLTYNRVVSLARNLQCGLDCLLVSPSDLPASGSLALRSLKEPSGSSRDLFYF